MKRRLINTKFWSDNFIVELDPMQRYLFLYFLTNEHTEICGVYELPLKVMERETGLESEILLNIIKRFSDKINYIDGWVFIKNFTKNQCANKSMEIGAEKSLNLVPTEIMAKYKQKQHPTTPSDTLGTPSEILESKLESKLELEPESEILQTEVCGILPDLTKDKNKHIQIIGLYAKAKKIIFENKEQQNAFIKRNLREASNLKGYDFNKIANTMFFLINNADFKWTLESVGKYIDENLNNLNNLKNKGKTYDLTNL